MPERRQLAATSASPMTELFRSKLPEVLRAIAPLLASVTLLQLVLVRAPLGQFLQFLAGSVLAIVGMLMLLAGIDHGVLPMGRYVGAELPRKGSVWIIIAVAGALGFVTTAAEPDVLMLAGQVEAVGGGLMGARTLGYIIAAGVGLFSAAALWCIAHGSSMTRPLAAAFAVILVLSVLSTQRMVPLAHDAGSVTTGVLSAPVLMALGLGVSAVLARHSGSLDGFGILGMASAGPIILLLLVGCLR